VTTCFGLPRTRVHAPIFLYSGRSRLVGKAQNTTTLFCWRMEHAFPLRLMNETALLTFPRAHRSLPLINSSPRAWVEKKVRAQPLGSKLNMKVRYSLRPDRPVGKRMKM